MIKYLSVAELLFEGGWNCSTGYSKDEFDTTQPYVTIVSDPMAYCGRGLNTIYYKGRTIASELMHRPTWGIELEGPSIGLYTDAEKWLLINLTDVISDFK